MGLDSSEEPMKGNDVDDQPTPIVKLPQACEYGQLLSKFADAHPLVFSIVNVANMQSSMNKLIKMSSSNINITQIDSYFHSMIYGEGIIMGL